MNVNMMQNCGDSLLCEIEKMMWPQDQGAYLPSGQQMNMESPRGQSSQRTSRNMAEQRRRKDLNIFIGRIASLVATVFGSTRRMDKITILRLAAACLRISKATGIGIGYLSQMYPKFNLEEYFNDTMIGSEGFVIALTCTGTVIYVSRQVKEHFGYAQDDLFGLSFCQVIHPDDHEVLMRNITLDDTYCSGVTITEISNENSNSSDDSISRRMDKSSFWKQKRKFTVRMAERTGSKREDVKYEIIEISGHFQPWKTSQDEENGENRNGEHLNADKFLFTAIARLPKKRSLTKLYKIDGIKNEYCTRHLLDGRIIYIDHRVSSIAGYFSAQVEGCSAFSFMHKDDVLWTIIGLRQMYDRAESVGTSCYRLKSQKGEYIYLRTQAHLEYDKDTRTIVSFVCINTLVSKEEGEKLILEMKERYAEAYANLLAMGQDFLRQSLDDRFQLEDAVRSIFSDLSSPNANAARNSLLQPATQSVSEPVNAIVPNSPNGSQTCSPRPVQPCDFNGQYNLKRISEEDIQETSTKKRRNNDGFLPTSNGDVSINLDFDTNPAVFGNISTTEFSQPHTKKELEQMMWGNQDMRDEITRKHMEVKSMIERRNPQLDKLARDLKNTNLPVQQEKLTQYKIEQEKQEETLKTIQQDYQNLPRCTV